MSGRTENDARRTLIAAVSTLSGISRVGFTAGELSWRWPRSAAEGMLIATAQPPHRRLVADDPAWLPLDSRATASHMPDSHVPDSDAPGSLAPDSLAPGSHGPGSHGPRSHGRDGLAAMSGALGKCAPDSVGTDAARLPSTWTLHRDLLVARPAIASVLLLQGPEAVALACSARIQREGVPVFHASGALAAGVDLRCAPYAPAGSPQLSDGVLAALADRHACLLANRGLVVVGVDPAAALTLAFEMEALCGQYRRLLMLGDPVPLSRHGAMT